MRRLDGVYTLGIVLVSRPVRRVGLFSVVLAILLGLAASSFQPQTTLGETGSASANRLWSSGAELNSTTADMEFTSSSGTVSISSSTKRSGDYAYRANPTSSTGLFYKTWANSTQSNKFWFRTYLRIADDPSANTYVMQVGSGASGKISLQLTTTSTLQLRNEEDNTNIGSASSALSLNTWYRLELYVDTTTLSSTDATFRLDGASIASSTAENLAAAIDRLTWGSSASGTTDLFFDDIAINDSTARAADNWPGEGRIVHMQPNGDSGANNWTGYPSDTNDYDDVDEVTPNGDTDTNYETTANDTRDYDLESATSALIGANDYIKLVSVGARVKNCGQAPGGPACISGEGGVDYSYRTRITAGGNTEESANIGIDELQSSTYHTNDDDVSKLNKLTLYDMPGTSTAQWTVSDLDGMQIGVKNINTQGYNVTAEWLQVEYADRSGGRLISSGFELNSATAGMEISAVTNTPSIDSTTFRSGAYALSTENGGGQEYARFYFESADTNNDYYARAYMRIVTTLNNSNATVLSLLDTSNLRRAYLKLTTTSTLELWDEDGQIGSASSALSTGTWYRLELRLNTTPSAGSHVVDGKIDGTSFASASNRSVGTGVARLGMGVNASDSLESSANTQGSILWDDIALNKAVGANQNSWPGAGAIIHLRPDADDSTNTAWTNGFANVDEVTPNDATDLVSETTSGDIDDYDLAASSVGASDVVGVVSVGVRFRSNTATQEDFRVRLKDSASGIAIESNNLSPASTTWTTNATADPKIYPLTAYTRPELSTAWFDAQLDTAQVGVRDVLNGTGTAEVTALWLLVDYSPPATILVTGTCDQFDQTTDCTDDGANAIAFAVNGTLQGQTDTVVDGAWSISGVTQPTTGDIITVFIDGETTDNEEAVAVAKYDGTGDITGVILYHRHLTIGSADNQTLSNSDIDAYDNSVSADEDIFFEVTAGNDLTVDTLGSYTDEELYILGSNVYQPASGGGGDVTTVHIENDGTFTANTNAITVNGSWQNDGSFGAGTSSVTMNSTTTGRTLSGTMTGGSAFYDLTFNGSGGAWSFSAAAETDRDFIITAGTVTAPSGNLTIARNFTNNGTFTHNSGTVVLDTTTTATVTSATGGTTFNNFTSTTATKTIQFTKHTTGTPVFTFAGTFTITGTSGNLINLYSDTSGTQWKAHFNAAQYSVSFINLRDGGCDTGTSNVYLDSGSTSVSNNDTCWVFPINRLWSGGAELQSATAQVETNFNDGSSLSVNTTTKRSGDASWRVNPTSSNAAFNKYYVNTPTQGKYWARFYIYVASAPNTEIGIFNFNGAATRISVRMNTDRSIELWNEEDNLQIGSASSALSASTWYRVEVYHDTTTLASTSAELRLNGTSVASGTANLAGASDRVQWGVLETAGTADLYFDDIAVNGPSNSADNWPGEGKIVHMQPNADGDNVAWTDSGANSVDYDELEPSSGSPTPDDGTDYIHSSTAGNLEDVDLESSSSAGIGANDTITAVSVGLRFRACNSGGACLIASGDNYKARIKASSGGTLEESGLLNADNISYNTNYNTASPTANLYPITLLDLPGSSASKWTPTNLDSAQIGMNHVSHENGFRTSTMWLLVEYIPVTNVTGTCDQYDQTTDCVDDGSNEIKVAINGSLQSGSDATVDGAWSVAITTPTTGDVITVFINGESTDNEEANAVTVYDGSGDITGVVLFQRHLTIGSADNQTITNTNLAIYDNSVSSDEDIFFDVSAGNDLTVDSLTSYSDEELYIVTGNTFRPASGGGADVTTFDVENDGTWTADSNSIFVGGSWQNDGTFTAGTSTVDFTATTTSKTLSGTLTGASGQFNALTFSGSGGGWSNSSAMTVSGVLTMTDGTLSGTNNITVNGNVQGTSGAINLTGGTFEHALTASRNFGTTSGSTAWTFNDLTFSNTCTSLCSGRTATTQTGGTGGITVSGVLRIGKSGDSVGATTTLNAGNRTWTLSGTGGDPFQILASPAGSLSEATSTFSYTGNNGAGNTTVQTDTYYNLDINNSSETFVTEGNTSASNDLTITNGVLSTTGSNHSLTITRDLTLSNTSGVGLTANGSTITVSRHFTDSGDKYTHGTSNLTLNGTGTLTAASTSVYYTLSIGYSTFTTSLSNNAFQITNSLNLNGGSVSSAGSYFELDCSSNCNRVTFNSATTLSGTRTLFFRNIANSVTNTIASGNYGTWALRAFVTGAGYTSSTYNLGGNVTSTDSLQLEAANGATGSVFNTQNYTLSLSQFLFGNSAQSRAASWTANFGSSTVTLSGTTDALAVNSNGGSHTLNLSTSSITVSGNVLFSSGTGTVTVDDGTSTLTWVNTSGTKTYAPNSQTLYNVTLNGSGGSVQPSAAAIIANDLTMTAGTLSGTSNVTVNGTVQGTAGIINLTGGTFEQRVTANENFGTTSGSTAWTFSDLTFSNASVLDNWWTITTQTGGTGGITVSGVMRVNRAAGANDNDGIILTGGNRTWTLSGTGGNPLRMETTDFGGFIGQVTPGTSTFSYTGNNAGGNTTVEQNPSGVGYYNLIIDNASETFVLEGNTTVGNDLTVTNGVLSTTGSNFSLTIARDLTLANTSGVGLTGNGSTITVSRDWNDLGNKFTQAGSTVVMNGTGNLNLVGNYGFNNISMAYSGFTTTLAAGTLFPDNDGVITLNGGTYAMGSNYTHVNRATTGTSLVFASPTTITSSGIGFSFANMAAGITQTVPGANYGDANITLQVSRGGGTGNVMQFGGNVTTTGTITAHSYSSSGTSSGSFNTQGYTLSASSLSIGHSSFTDAITIDFGASTVTLSSTGTSLAVVSTVGGQTHQLNLQSSSVSVSGGVLFINGSGTMNVNPGTSTVTWTHTSGTKSYAPNGQSLYNMAINGAGGTLTPTAAVDVNNNFTITNGTYDTVNGSNFALTVDNNFTGASGTWTFQARAATITVSGNWDTSAIGADDSSFVRTTSTVVMNGSGTKTITTGSTNVWQHRFYNLTVGQSGNTTRMMQTFGVENQINLGTGTFDLNSKLLYNSGTNANFLNLNASGTWGTGNGAYAPYGSNNKNIPAFTYNSGLQTEQNTGFKTIFQGNASFTSFVIGCCSRASEIDINGYTVTVTGNVTFGTTTAILTLGSGTLNVGGNWVNTNNAVFNANTGTVALNGSSTQTLSGLMTGANAFYNLTITNSSGTNASDCERTGFVAGVDFAAAVTVSNNTTFTTASSRVEFNSGSTYTLNNINWNGQASGTRVYFRNSAASGSWNLNVSGTQTAVSYVNVSRSDASSGNTIQAANGTNVDCNNNVNWSFNNPGSPSSLSQKKTNDTVLSVGSWTNETSVKFTATITDADSNNVQICVENADIYDAFTNTETACGSLVSSGSTATVTISGLTNASQYHWQARAKDTAGYYSSWVAFGGNSDVGDPADMDFGVDTTACTYSGSIYDGTTEDVDASLNDGSLTALSANWDAFSCGASGLNKYEYSIGTTIGGTDIKSWTDNSTPESVTSTGLVLRTNQRYYFNVRAVDNASNTSSEFNSNGQDVMPTITFTLGSTTVTFSNLNDNNNRTDSKTLGLTTSTNAYGGYVIRQYAAGLLTGGSSTIPMFQAGTYASPAAWPGSFCTSGADCGYGYTSDDTTIQGSNKFSSGTLFAAFSTTAFGDIVADHTANVTGATGAVSNESFTITHKVSVDALQNAKTYQAEVLYLVTGTF